MQAAVNEEFGMLAQFLPMADEGQIGVAEHSVKVLPAAYSVLIMEDSVPLARLLAKGIAAEQLSVDVTHDLESTMRHLGQASYDLLILDLDLPGLDLPDVDGLQLLRNLRARWPEARILALSGRGGVEGLVTALDHGADDYLPKPFSLLEMMARIRALRRRSHASAQAAASKGSKVVLHKDQCRVERDGRSIELTPREFTLLEYMMQNPGKTLSRSMLTQEVWNMPAESNTNIVDVYIKYLRDKLDGESDFKLIRTVRGLGYLFQAQA